MAGWLNTKHKISSWSIACVCVYVYVYLYVCVCVCVRVSVYVCLYVGVKGRVFVHLGWMLDCE